MPIWQKGRVNMRVAYAEMRKTMSYNEIIMKYNTVLDTLSYIGNGFFPDIKLRLINEKNEKVISRIQERVRRDAYDALDSCIEYIDWGRLKLYKDLVDQFCYCDSKQLMCSICNTITALMLEEIDDIYEYLWSIILKNTQQGERK